MNILFVRLSYIGDILHATAAARWIKQHYPNAVMHWVVTPSMAELLEHNPYVDHIIPWERDVYEAHSKKLHLPTMWRMWWELRKKLKPYHFDVAVDVQGRLITGLVLLASGAPIRLGLGGTKELNWLFTNYKTKHRNGNVIEQYLEVAKLLPQAVPINETQSAYNDVTESGAVDDIDSADTIGNIDSMDAFDNTDSADFIEDTDSTDFIEDTDSTGTVDDRHVDSILELDLIVTDDEYKAAEKMVEQSFQDHDRPTIGLVLGASWQSKEWPDYNWKQLIESMSYRANFICFGGPKEVDVFAPLMTYIEEENLPVYNAIGKTTLREMAALLKACDVVVSGDTGGLHMASALRRPVIALFGPTDPDEWGPLTGIYDILDNESLDCLGCRKRKCPKGKALCMSGIDPIMVKESIVNLINQGE